MTQFITPLEPMASSADFKFDFFDVNDDSLVNEQNSLRGFILQSNTFWRRKFPFQTFEHNLQSNI